MASAIMGGMIKNEVFKAEEVIASDLSQKARSKVERELGVSVTDSNVQVVRKAQILVLAVKPQYYEEVISEIREEVRPDQIIVTIAPGWTLEKLGRAFGRPFKIVRTMPNTPALVGEGITGAAPNELVEPEEMDRVLKMLRSFGRAEVIPESLMDVVVSVSGSSPAYVFLMIEAMADAAVADGMPREQAYTFAAQAVYGSAKMVLETGKHPGELKDMVCSPAGTTIEAVGVLEKKGFRSAIFECMRACARKAREM